MSRLVAYLLWCTVLSLALPAGWCRAVAELRPSELVSSKSCCCPNDLPAAASPGGSGTTSCPIPASQAACCCETRLPAPIKSASPPLDIELSVLAVRSPLAILCPISLLTGPSEPRTNFGPPLHVMKCVWRC